MSKTSILALGLAVGLAVAGGARAATLEWQGSARIALVTSLNKATIFTGSGVATVNGSAGVDITMFRPTGFLGGTQTTPLTDPENATLITLIGTGQLGSGTFTGIASGMINGNDTLPVPGKSKVCILFPGCANYIPVPFTKNGGTAGIGVGGTITANTFSAGPGFKASLVGRPWTLGLTSVTDVETVGHMESGTTTTQGFIHGPASNTSTAAQIGGVIQVVTAAVVFTSLAPPNDRQGQLSFGRFRFIPEPGMLLLLGSGVAGLALIGRSRLRR
jgi:hypothetical protein